MLLAWSQTPPSDELLQQAATILQQGGVAVFPTETFYGLGCDPRHDAAVARLNLLKERPAGKPLPLVAASVEHAAGVINVPVAVTAAYSRLATRFWPGPLTLVAPAHPGLSRGVLAQDSTVAVRVTSHPVARHLADLAGGLLVATSANKAGQPPVSVAGDIDEALRRHVDLVVDGGPSPGERPSTILRLSGEGNRVVRDGVVTREQLIAAGVELS